MTSLFGYPEKVSYTVLLLSPLNAHVLVSSVGRCLFQQNFNPAIKVTERCTI